MNLHWVNSLRVFAAFAVVCLHVAGNVLASVSDTTSTYWWMGNVVDSSVRWSIPAFVLISGALLLDPKKDERIAVFYKKRARRLLVPMIFWSVAYNAPRSLSLEAYSLSNMFAAIVNVRVGHLWYLYMILGLYLFTPFLRTYIRSSSLKERWCLIGVLLALSSLTSFLSWFVFAVEPPARLLTLYLSYLGYFLCGYQLRLIDPYKVSVKVLLVSIACSIIVIAFGTYLLVEHFGLRRGMYLYHYCSPPVAVVAVAVFLLVRRMGFSQHQSSSWVGRRIDKLAPATLGVYVLHPFVIRAFQEINFSTSSFHPVLSIPLVSIAAFLLSCLGVAVVMKTPYLRRTVC